MVWYGMLFYGMVSCVKMHKCALKHIKPEYLCFIFKVEFMYCEGKFTTLVIFCL